MVWTKRRKHLSRAARAQLREQSQQRQRTGTERKCHEEPAPIRQVAKARDLDYLVARHTDRQHPEIRARYRAILAAALARRPGLLDNPYLGGLYVLAELAWRRDPAQWRPRGRGLCVAYRSLAEHLHGHYPISRHLWDGFLITVYGDDSDRLALDFVSRVSSGVSPRSLVGSEVMPAPLTRRMLHLTLNPPQPMSLGEATRRAQVLCYGGPEWLAGVLGKAGFSEFVADEPYWSTVIHWFCRQECGDRQTYQDLIEYLKTMHREQEPVALAGRTMLSLRREQARILKTRDEAERKAWKEEIASTPAAPPCDIGDYSHGEWRITRIRNARKLILEGAAMRHCVARHRYDQESGTLTFWSLTHHGRRALTLSVHTPTRRLDGIAGRSNRDPRRDELVPVEAWARRNRVGIGPWLDEWPLFGRPDPTAAGA